MIAWLRCLFGSSLKLVDDDDDNAGFFPEYFVTAGENMDHGTRVSRGQ
jgi:hypothetical protein